MKPSEYTRGPFFFVKLSNRGDSESNRLQVFMNQLNGNGPLSHGGSYASNSAMPDIASGKYAWDVGFKYKRISLEGPTLRSITAKKQIRTGANEMILILLYQVSGYFRAGDGTDKNKDGGGFFDNGFTTLPVFSGDCLKFFCSFDSDYFRVGERRNILCLVDLVNQVGRHGLLQISVPIYQHDFAGKTG
jgi:hypothetical protein